jgi:hypothetical protein
LFPGNFIYIISRKKFYGVHSHSLCYNSTSSLERNTKLRRPRLQSSSFIASWICRTELPHCWHCLLGCSVVPLLQAAKSDSMSVSIKKEELGKLTPKAVPVASASFVPSMVEKQVRCIVCPSGTISAKSGPEVPTSANQSSINSLGSRSSSSSNRHTVVSTGSKSAKSGASGRISIKSLAAATAAAEAAASTTAEAASYGVASPYEVSRKSQANVMIGTL